MPLAWTAETEAEAYVMGTTYVGWQEIACVGKGLPADAPWPEYLRWEDRYPTNVVALEHAEEDAHYQSDKYVKGIYGFELTEAEVCGKHIGYPHSASDCRLTTGDGQFPPWKGGIR